VPGHRPGKICRCGAAQFRRRTGRWSFTNALYVGALPQPFKFSAYSPFFPKAAMFEGQLTAGGPDLSNVVLKFDSVADTTGRLGITVVNASGQPVGEGFPLWINYLGDYSHGSKRSHLVRLPAMGTQRFATYAEPVAAARGSANLTNEVTMQLLATGNAVEFSTGRPLERSLSAASELSGSAGLVADTNGGLGWRMFTSANIRSG
jgi:hypothetical protein